MLEHQQTFAKKREKAKKKGKKPGKQVHNAQSQQKNQSGRLSQAQLQNTSIAQSRNSRQPQGLQTENSIPHSNNIERDRSKLVANSSSAFDQNNQPRQHVIQQINDQITYNANEFFETNIIDNQRPSKTQVANQSPHKKKQRSFSAPDKDVFEQLAEYQVLDKVLPCLDKAEGFFVQINKTGEFGTLMNVNGEQLTIKIYGGDIYTSVELSQVKFLAGAYICHIADIDFNKGNNEKLIEDLDLKRKDYESESTLILIQTISYQLSQVGDKNQVQGSSIHRLHVLTFKKDSENQPNNFRLHPTSFKNTQNTIKQLKKQRLTTKYDQDNDEMNSYYYKDDQTAKLVSLGRKIQSALSEYHQRVQKIQLSELNQNELLNSVCYFESQVGILTRVNNGLAYLRQLRTNQDQIESNDQWINFKEKGVYADLTLGFVAQSTLYQNCLLDVKIRNMKFVSQKEIKNQMLLKDQVHSVDDLCKICKYIKVDSIKTMVCGRCQLSFHEKCLASHQVKQQSDCNWVCPDCAKCITCQAGQNNLLVCGECNLSVHINCIDPDYKQIINCSDLKDPSDFRCQNCIKCTACGRTDPGQGKWAKDFKLCVNCDKKRDQNMFCGGCVQFLPEDETHDQMLKCASCQMFIHKSCDRMLEDAFILQKFEVQQDSSPMILYCCVSCRQKSRTNFIEQILEQIISEDKKNEFLYPFWQTPSNSQYLTIIKEPICFQNIKDEIKSFDPNFAQNTKFAELRYLSKPETFKNDIEKIFRNAKTFNPIQSEIHKLAVKMHEKCNQIWKQGRIWEIFEINADVTQDELQNLKFLRKQINQPNYLRKPKDLFLPHEQIDIRQFQYLLQQSNSNLGKRARELIASNQAPKRLKISENQDQMLNSSAHTDEITQQQQQPHLTILASDHKKILQEANKRLILQNLGNLLQNLQNKQLSNITRTDKTSSLLLHQNQFDSYQNEQQLSPKSRWRHLMDDLRTSDERDSCWYSSPLRVSFEDPSLIFEEMCYLCGSFGLKDEFLSCNFCSESFHPYCLPCPKDSIKAIQDHWFCYNCVFCEKCHSSRQWEFLVLCQVCEKAYHIQCLQPQLIQVPENSWKCPDCFKCRTCGTLEFFSDEDIENKVNLDPNEKYILSFDFEFCYQCGQDQYRQSICNMCKNKTGLGLEPLQVQKKNFYQNVELATVDMCKKINLYKCVKCKFYSHLECSRTSINSLEYLESQPDFAGFQCLDCLLIYKQPGYYLHEQCMIYADFHDRIMAFQTVEQLCKQILSKYCQDNLILLEYVKQNFNWFQKDEVIQKWIKLLRTEVEEQDLFQSEIENMGQQEQITHLETEQDKSVDKFKYQMNISEQSEIFHQIESDLRQLKSNDHDTDVSMKETFQPRDMYVNLYLKNNRTFKKVSDIPQIDFNQEWLQNDRIQFDELFAAIELRCVIKIRLHFFNWIEHGLVAPSIKNAHMIEQPLLVQHVQENLIQTCDQNDLYDEQALIKTVTPKDEQAELITEICQEKDYIIPNPQLKLTCILCQQSGERRITGRLIPFQVNQFVHVNCAMWTSEVQEGTEETVVSSELYNFFFAFKHYRQNKCSICDLKGATLICANYCINKKCPQPYYHFPCAYESGKVSFQNTCEIFCLSCTKKEKDLVPGLPIKFKDYHRRRVLILKNLQPQCTTAFNNGNNQVEQTEVENKNGALLSSSPQQQQQYIVNCNKWRPFYYDMFNRAGNLTILSLSQAANTIIEGLHNLSHQQTTWHQRFKKQDLHKKHSDFASLRIFWKDGSFTEKGFYLFNQDKVIQIQNPNPSYIIDYVQKLMISRLNTPIVSQIQPDEKIINIQEFWQNQFNYLKRRYSNFSQDSTYLTPQLLCGLEKYPIQFWNNPMEIVKLPLRDMNVVNFFYKSAERAIKIQQLYTQKSQIEPVINSSLDQQQNQAQSGLHQIFQSILKANKYVNQDGFTLEEVQNLKNSKFVSVPPNENQIKQLLGSLDKSQPVLNQFSYRNMNYEQVMGCLGKKTIKQRKLKRTAQIQLVSDSEEEKINHNSLKGQSGQIVQELDVNKQSSEMVIKGNEINLAMKYRAAKDKPKSVEVWTSKIHRNGLFACQAFNQKDIVIEYVGEKIRVPVANKREKYYEKLGVGDCYLFSLDTDNIIDATFYGNKARYINHSCDPNLKSDKLVVDKETHIIFMANRYIESGEELTFDYQFEYEGEAEKLECFCGSAICKGRLN